MQAEDDSVTKRREVSKYSPHCTYLFFFIFSLYKKQNAGRVTISVAMTPTMNPTQPVMTRGSVQEVEELSAESESVM